MTETPSPREDARLDAEPGHADSGFHVHWDRASLFLVGVGALAVALVTALCALAGLPTAGLAGWSLLVTVGAVVGLRVLAARGQREHHDDLADDADEPDLAEEDLDTHELPVVPDPERDRRVLAAALSLTDEVEDEEPAAEPVPVVVDALQRRRAPRIPLGGIVIPEVPRPTYLDAPEAPAAEAEAEDPAEDDAVATRPEAEEQAASAEVVEIPEPAARAAVLDLDGVLARRRAS